MIGSPEALRYSRRDVVGLRAIVPLVPSLKVCVQAGGNLGVYPHYLAGLFDVVYTFEPDQENFAALCANTPQPNVVKLQLALSDHVDWVSTACTRRDGSDKPPHPGLTYLDGPGPIPAIPLDLLALPRCDLLLLDVEGYEYRALLGASETLARCRPVVVVELNRHLHEAGSSPEHVRALLAAHDYRAAMTVQSDVVFTPCEVARA